MGINLNNKSVGEGLIRTFLPLLLDEFEVIHNGSISYLSSNNSNYLVLLSNIIDFFYQGRQLVEDLDEYTPITFNETLQYGFNTFFVRDINGTVCVARFVGMNNLDFILEDRLYLLEMHPYWNKIQNLIANDLLCELNSSDYETDWIYAAKTSIAAIKAGTELNNNTLTSEGYTKLNQLCEKDYYINDNDSAGYKLVIAEYLLNYNMSYAEAIVNYVISLLFHTPYGLEPIAATEKLLHQLEGVDFIGVFKLKYLEVLPKLAVKVNNSTYLDIFKEILRYWLSNLYYNKVTDMYLHAIKTNYTVHSFDAIEYVIHQITLFSLKVTLPYLLNFVNASETIVDRSPPESQVSYWIGKKTKFPIDDDQYKNINNVANIAPVENKELFLRVKLSDNYGIGLKSSKIYANGTVTTPDTPLCRGTDWLYLEFIHSSLSIKNATDTFDYFIDLPFKDLNVGRTYKIEATDKYGNKVVIEIKLMPLEVNTSTIGIPLTYILSLIIGPIILNSIYHNRKTRL